MSLFAALRGPAIIIPVDRDGPVVRDDVDETLILPYPKLAWDSARIELHKHAATGNWMWSASAFTSGGGHTYKVGEKWGKFAATRDDALYHAIQELRNSTRRDAETSRILAWLDKLEVGL